MADRIVVIRIKDQVFEMTGEKLCSQFYGPPTIEELSGWIETQDEDGIFAIQEAICELNDFCDFTTEDWDSCTIQWKE
jgi:hypothetical protein